MEKTVEIRLFNSEDSIEELTGLINRAYLSIDSADVRLEGADQTAERTRQRINRGSCLIAVLDARIVGTLTMSAGVNDPAFSYLGRSNFACRYQIAVDPDLQGLGIGYALRQESERWARELDFAEMVGYTPATHVKQIEYSLRGGSIEIGRIQWPGDSYVSVVFAKKL